MLNDRKGRHKVCCFTGHRKFNTPIEILNANLENIISELYNDGISYFCTGGALGFDTVAAKKILSMKENFNDIKLVLVLPCKDQTKVWYNADIAEYENIKSKADKIIYITDSYTPTCMFERNRYLVDVSSVCVALYERNSGGTAYTVNYANLKGLKIYNVAS